MREGKGGRVAERAAQGSAEPIRRLYRIAGVAPGLALQGSPVRSRHCCGQDLWWKSLLADTTLRLIHMCLSNKFDRQLKDRISTTKPQAKDTEAHRIL